jgi:hypothetical protein
MEAFERNFRKTAQPLAERRTKAIINWFHRKDKPISSIAESAYIQGFLDCYDGISGESKCQS